MSLLPPSHDDSRARQWFARLDPVMRLHRLRQMPHGMAVLAAALNAAGVHAGLLSCRMEATVAGRRQLQSLDSAPLLLVDGCLVHSHGTVGLQAWKSAHLQAHNDFHATLQPIISPSNHLASPIDHAPGQAGFNAIKPCQTRLVGPPRSVSIQEIYKPGGVDPWPDRLASIAAALSSPAQVLVKSRSSCRPTPAPPDIGTPSELSSLDLDSLARHWMEYGKASSSNLLWAAANLMDNGKDPSVRFWCRAVKGFDAQDVLSSDVSIALSFQSGANRLLAHLGDPARWGRPEPTIDGGVRDPCFRALYCNYLDFVPDQEWAASYSRWRLSRTTPANKNRPTAPRF